MVILNRVRIFYNDEQKRTRLGEKERSRENGKIETEMHTQNCDENRCCRVNTLLCGNVDVECWKKQHSHTALSLSMNCVCISRKYIPIVSSAFLNAGSYGQRAQYVFLSCFSLYCDPPGGLPLHENMRRGVLLHNDDIVWYWATRRKKEKFDL